LECGVLRTCAGSRLSRRRFSLNLEDLYAHHLLEAGDQGEAERVRTLLKKLEATDKRLESRAKALGLHACAQE
jgi:phage baseplate assembly protein W